MSKYTYTESIINATPQAEINFKIERIRSICHIFTRPIPDDDPYSRYFHDGTSYVAHRILDIINK